ncbi:MAG: hypothetical protein JSS02_16200 [Planctomycetes bacterium]|nr:hypothetical protein [Planctomycetota bacterium]
MGGPLHERNRSREGQMLVLLLTLAVAFGSFCVWLFVRIVNRRERWAMWTVAALPALLVFAYLGAYALLYEPMWTIPYFGAANWERYPVLRGSQSNDELFRSVFGVAHRIDRKLRADFWSETRPYRGGKHP